MGQAYSGFAQVYDLFMDNVPYEKWCDFLMKKFEKYGYTPNMKVDLSQYDLNALGVDLSDENYEKNIEEEHNSVLDLGCGTGTLTRMLAKKGFDMIGVDLSEQMLDIAHEKEFEAEEESGIIYLCQDMCELELFGTIGAVVSVCDCINYVLSKEKVLQVFKQVNNYLFPGGLFIFDFNTVHKYKDVIGDATIAENRDDASFIWNNYYHEKERINEYELSIFVKEEYEEDDEEDDESEESEDAGVPYLRFTETHYQKGYTLEEITECLKEAGLLLLEAIDGDSFKEANENSERIFIIAKECMKDKKHE